MLNFRRSRCVEPSNAPQHLHWAEIDGDPFAVQREMVDALKASVTADVALHALSDVRASLETIERCCLLEPSQVEAVSRDSSLFEIKLSFEPWNVLVRIYETEDPGLPRNIVALRSHRKMVDVSDEEIRERQNDEIDVARARHMHGRPTLWGLRPAL